MGAAAVHGFWVEHSSLRPGSYQSLFQHLWGLPPHPPSTILGLHVVAAGAYSYSFSIVTATGLPASSSLLFIDLFSSLAFCAVPSSGIGEFALSWLLPVKTTPNAPAFPVRSLTPLRPLRSLSLEPYWCGCLRTCRLFCRSLWRNSRHFVFLLCYFSFRFLC